MNANFFDYRLTGLINLEFHLPSNQVFIYYNNKLLNNSEINLEVIENIRKFVNDHKFENFFSTKEFDEKEQTAYDMLKEFYSKLICPAINMQALYRQDENIFMDNLGKAVGRFRTEYIESKIKYLMDKFDLKKLKEQNIEARDRYIKAVKLLPAAARKFEKQEYIKEADEKIKKAIFELGKEHQGQDYGEKTEKLNKLVDYKPYEIEELLNNKNENTKSIIAENFAITDGQGITD